MATGQGGAVTGGKGGTMAGGSGGTVTGGQGGSVIGGKGGTNAGGTGGIICPPVACPAIGCPYGELPNPDRCGCPICAPPPDAGVKDAAADACVIPPCVPIVCNARELMVTPPCGCPTCVPVDAGTSDAIICPPVACPAIRCAYGIAPNPDPCGCPTCAPPPDAGTDSGKLACVELDECTCLNTKGCSPIAETCYCPTQCTSAVCSCGGGRFLGCAPQALGTCAAARDRVAALCPALKGAVFDGLCKRTDSLCVTKCLNAVASCGDIACSMCEGCDCAGDAFSRCQAECGKVLAQ